MSTHPAWLLPCGGQASIGPSSRACGFGRWRRSSFAFGSWFSLSSG
jgi:hypothetical protein